MTKHEEIINYIKTLAVGTKISVRGIANNLGVSDGTAYSAIKDGGSLGLVTTIPRIGTVRIEKLEKRNLGTLTYGQVINIINGTLLGGREGIHKTLNKFVIGAMTIDAMEKYINPGSLLIVGNREGAQRLALTNESAVLITGGFSCSEDIKNLANNKCLPIISSTYDTFTIASMINKAISENLIKKEIIQIEDIMKDKLYYLNSNSTIKEWRELMVVLGYEKFPVIDNDMKLVGVITLNDIGENAKNDECISKYMSKDPITVGLKTTVAYASHVMRWEGIEMFPVVENKKLIGIVTKQDLNRAFQYISNHPQEGETIENLILQNFKFEVKEEQMRFRGKIKPEMLDYAGTASWGSLNMLMTTVGLMSLRRKDNKNISVDSMMTYFTKPVQMDSEISIDTKIIDMGRNFSKVEISMYNENKELVSKAILSAVVFSR
jgi:predicted transcriptional regulator